MAIDSHLLRFRRLKWFVICCVAALIMSLSFFKQEQSVAVDLPTNSIVQKQGVSNEKPKAMLSVIGTIEAGQVISIAAPFDGMVKEKNFSFDTIVTVDQSLLRLDSSELQGRINEARVAMLRAENVKQDLDRWEKGPEVSRASRNHILAQQQLAQGEQRLQETEGLLNKGFVPRIEYESLIEQVNGLRVQLAASIDDLNAVRDKATPNNREITRIEYEQSVTKYKELTSALEHEKISAPRTGIVSRVTTTSGQGQPTLDAGSRVNKGQPLFAIATLDRLSVVSKVDEVDVLKLTPGQRAEIIIDGQEMLPIVGHLVEVGAQGIQTGGTVRSATFDIRIELPELSKQQQQLLRIGMSCNVNIFSDNVVTPKPVH